MDIRDSHICGRGLLCGSILLATLTMLGCMDDQEPIRHVNHKPANEPVWVRVEPSYKLYIEKEKPKPPPEPIKPAAMKYDYTVMRKLAIQDQHMLIVWIGFVDMKLQADLPHPYHAYVESGWNGIKHGVLLGYPYKDDLAIVAKWDRAPTDEEVLKAIKDFKAKWIDNPKERPPPPPPPPPPQTRRQQMFFVQPMQSGRSC